MKRFCLLAAFAAVMSWTALAQNANSPEVEEKLVRLGSDVERLLSINADLQKQISNLREDLARVREQASRPVDDSPSQAIREDLKKLAEKIQEVDRKRIEDKEIVASEFDKIEKLVKKGLSTSSPAPRTSRDSGSSSSGDRPERGYEYVVQSGDTISGIVALCNKQFKEEGKKTITEKQVLDANPNLKPTRMAVGQKIFIPIPDK